MTNIEKLKNLLFNRNLKVNNFNIFSGNNPEVTSEEMAGEVLKALEDWQNWEEVK